MARSIHQLNVGGHVRGLVLHAATPPAAPPSGHSLLLLLHGSSEDRNNGSVHYPAERFERNYHAVFAGHGFVLVYLSARLSNGWYCWENGNAEVGLCARSSCLLNMPAAAMPQLASLVSRGCQSHLRAKGPWEVATWPRGWIWAGRGCRCHGPQVARRERPAFHTRRRRAGRA